MLATQKCRNECHILCCRLKALQLAAIFMSVHHMTLHTFVATSNCATSAYLVHEETQSIAKLNCFSKQCSGFEHVTLGRILKKQT